MKFNSVFKTIFYGLCLGISLLPPGFSVATMAMILGIYEDLISLLNDLFSVKMKSVFKALFFLGVGAIVAIAAFTAIISASFGLFPYQTRFFFIGLIVGTVPLIYRQAGVKKNFMMKHYIFLVVALLLTVSLVFADSFSLVEMDGDMTVVNILVLVLAGALLSVSMILPGLSGALVLMLLGVYWFLLESIRSFDFVVLASVAFGGVLGLVICGKVIKRLLDNNETSLYSVSLGLVIGSIPVMLSEGIPSSVFDVFTSLLTCIAGFGVVVILNSMKK